MKRKVLLSIFGVCGLLLAVVSCDKEKMRVPEPEVNPVVLTSEAQSKDIKVRYLMSLDTSAEMEAGYNDIGNVISQTIRYGDWLEVFYNTQQKFDSNQTITITVKENTSSEPRSFTFNLHAFIKGVDLTITQEGKK